MLARLKKLSVLHKNLIFIDFFLFTWMELVFYETLQISFIRGRGNSKTVEPK